MSYPDPLVVLLKGMQTMTITGAVSDTMVDLDVYDAGTYRDLLPANYLGRTWSSDFPALAVPAPENEDDIVNHVAPRFHQKKRTMMIWWSGAGGTGTICGKCWVDQFIGYADSATFIS